MFNILASANFWQYAFMRNALIAGAVTSVVAGIVGYFVVLRKLSFGAHALSHAGFAGAAGAVLLGVNHFMVYWRLLYLVD